MPEENPLISLTKLVAVLKRERESTSHPTEGDERTDKEVQDYEDRRVERHGKKQDIKQRKLYADRVFRLVCW